MSYFRAKYPTTNEQKRSDFYFPENSDIGNARDCKFYRASSGKPRGVAFRMAFDAATQSTNHKDLCAYVGSMLYAVSDDLRNSVLEALHGVGVEPHYEQQSLSTDEAGVTQMDWPSILVNFGCICILLLKNTNEESYQTFMSSCIGDLQRKVGYEPGIQLNVPFDFPKANAIRTMFGACLSLRTAVVTFIIGTMSKGRGSTSSVCQYLFNIISWTGMDELIDMNEMLVIPKSPVLHDPRFAREAENLAEACEAIEAHPYPQFFMHLASNVELLKVEQSRFPNLIAFAQQMRVAEQNGSSAGGNSQQPLLLQMMNPVVQVLPKPAQLYLLQYLNRCCSISQPLLFFRLFIFLILCFCFVLLLIFWKFWFV